MSVLFPITEEMKEIFRTKYRNDPESLQDVLLILKSKGISQMQSVKLLIEEMNLSLSDADNIVLNSRAWINERSENISFRDSFFNTLFKEYNEKK